MNFKAKSILVGISLLLNSLMQPLAWGKPAVISKPNTTSPLSSIPNIESAPQKKFAKAGVVAVPETNEANPPKEAKVETGPKLAGYKSGFFIQSADGKYKLVINGYAQFHFEYLREDNENEATFRIRRARIAFKGNLVDKDFTYKFQIDLAKFRDELLLDAYLNYKINESFEVRFGQFSIPYIRQQLVSSSAQEFVDRSLAAKEFTNASDVDTNGDGIPDRLEKNGRDIGVMVHGTPYKNKMEYQVGVFNGNGTNSLNPNTDFLYMGRGVYNISGNYGYEEGDYNYTETPAIFIGGAGNYNTRDISKDKVTQFGAETGLKYRGLAAQGEFFFRNIKPGTETSTRQIDYGYYAQLGYFAVPKRLEVQARASQVFFEGLQNDQAEFMMGVNGFLLGKNVKLQTDYSVLPSNTEDGIETSQRFRLRMQTKF